MQPYPSPPPDIADTADIPTTLPPSAAGDCDYQYDYDWTEDLPQSDHVRFFRHTDWAQSQLGPLKHWGPTLQLFTRMLFADSRAACLWWGPHLVAIYNEAFMPLAAQAHPQLMGSTFRDGFPELWESIQPVFDEARRTGRGVEQSAAMPLMVERRGWREEAFFSGNFVPLSSRSTSQPEGFYNALIEVTDQQLAERRTTMLNRMASVPDPTLNAVYAHILKTLETNGNDIPLALLYEAKDRLGPTGLRLRGHIGLPTGHNLIVDGSDMDSLDGLIPDCRRADTAELVLIDYDERFGSISWGGFGSPSKKLAILPITSGSRIFAYLIVGTNPCRPLDDHCEQFLKNLGRMVSSIIFAAVNAEEAMKRQQQLESQLAFSDLKLRHLIEHASIGMAHMSLQGETLWANEHHYALSGRDAHDQQSPMAFLDGCLDEDRPKAQRAWDSLLESDNHVSVEVRTKRLFKSPIGDAEPAQVQILAFPYREHGITKSVMSCTTDISKLKWAQTFQARLAAEAREAKRQQEAFIDVVSHEMRNPLSAIVHCADGISNALDECHSKLAEIPQPCLDALTDNVAAANIIMQCANHQKRIIDDVLTLSRLDSMLLSITPSAVRPPKLVNSITGMFEAELKSHRIRCSVEPDASLSKLAIDYLYFDPSRVTQIFINLVTNAIKFVKPSNDRSISIRYGACLSDPHAFFAQDMFWATRSKHDCDVTANPEWGQGDEIYLTFLVQDSGIGLKSKDTHKIFERFGQANGRTHVNYGGSGLGLFISKELTEKQGGEIGVSSTLGNGSTFGFYIKARRVERPPQTLGELYHDSGKAGQAPEQLHVLLVEDNIINQQVLGKQLKKAGCLVDVANHGLEALDMLEKKTFDVVLMDLEMPVLNGLAAMQEIRKREVDREGLLGQALNDGLRGEQRLPIIAVTANVRQEQIDNAIAVGADRVMQKPFKATDLVHMMKGLVPQVTTPSTELPAPGLDGRIGDLVP